MKTLVVAAAAAVALAAPVAHAQAPEPTTLKFGFTSPATSFVHVFGSEPWSKEVEAASNGTLKIQMFFNNILGTVFNIYDRTVNGVVDISFGTIGTVQGTFPATSDTTYCNAASDPMPNPATDMIDPDFTWTEMQHSGLT